MPKLSKPMQDLLDGIRAAGVAGVHYTFASGVIYVANQQRTYRTSTLRALRNRGLVRVAGVGEKVRCGWNGAGMYQGGRVEAV